MAALARPPSRITGTRARSAEAAGADGKRAGAAARPAPAQRNYRLDRVLRGAGDRVFDAQLRVRVTS